MKTDDLESTIGVLSGVLFYGIPLEEFLFGVAFGLYWRGGTTTLPGPKAWRTPRGRSLDHAMLERLASIPVEFVLQPDAARAT